MASQKLLFTREDLAEIPAPIVRTTYKDTETRALILDVTPNAIKTFRIYRKINGKPERITLGRFNAKLPDSREFPKGTDLLKTMLVQPELNVKMARRLAEAVNVQLDAGANLAETKRTARGELTLGQMFERYVTDHAIPQKVRTIDKMRELFERYLGEVPDLPAKKHGRKRTKSPVGVNWQNRKLSSIQRDEVRKLHLAIGGILSATTANHVADLVNILFHKATDWGEFTGQSPAENLQLFPEISRARFLQPGELPAFWQALDEEHSEDYRDLVLLSILAGGRSGNTRAMKWSDIDMDACVWRIPDSESKNKAMLTIVLVPEAMEVLTRRRDAEGASSTWVFPAKSEAGHVSNQPKKWHALLARAGLKDLRFHDLRRSLGSWQARTGASLLIIGKSLGHKSQQATQIYAQLDTDPVRQSVERATAAMINGRVPNQNGKVVALPGVTVDLPAENLAKQA